MTAGRPERRALAVASLLLLGSSCARVDHEAELQRQMRCLSSGLESKDLDRQEAAVEGIERLGRRAAAAVPLLARTLADPEIDPELREQIFAVLSQLGPSAAAAVPAMIEATVREPSLEPLAQLAINRVGEPAEQQLLAVLRDDLKGAQRRQAALLAIWISLPETERALLAALRGDRAAEVRAAAARALGRRRAARSVDALARALDDEHFTVALAAAEALRQIPKEGDRALLAALRSGRATASLAAAAAVDPLDTWALRVLPSWLGVLDDRRWEVRATVARAIGKLGPAAAEAIPSLRKLLTDPVVEVQEAAEDALSRVESASR